MGRPSKARENALCRRNPKGGKLRGGAFVRETLMELNGPASAYEAYIFGQGVNPCAARQNLDLSQDWRIIVTV